MIVQVLKKLFKFIDNNLIYNILTLKMENKQFKLLKRNIKINVEKIFKLFLWTLKCLL